MAKRVLVLGGLGFIGRHMVKFLVDNKHASFVRVVDKAMVQTAYLGDEHKATFESDMVEYMQGDLCRDTTVTKAFTADAKFDIVINLAAETKFGLDEEVYDQKVVTLARKAGEAAKAHGVECFVEVSTAQVYESTSKPSSEKAKLKPWTKLARAKYAAEEALRGIAGLPLVVLRPAIVYGPGDVTGLAPRIICARVYKQLDEKMKFLWGGDLKINSVHVHDVVRAIWHVATMASPAPVYNLCDMTDLDQKKFNKILEKVFAIKTGFVGAMVSKLASVKLADIVESSNEKHLAPWGDICRAEKIGNTPLTPFMDLELLKHNHTNVDGNMVQSTGFKYERPIVTEKHVREQIDYSIKLGIFPPLS